MPNFYQKIIQFIKISVTFYFKLEVSVKVCKFKNKLTAAAEVDTGADELSARVEGRSLPDVAARHVLLPDASHRRPEAGRRQRNQVGSCFSL